MNFKHIIVTLSLILASSVGLSARTAKILYFKAPKSAPEKVFLYPTLSGSIEAKLPRNNFTKSIELADGDMKLYFLPSELDPRLEKLPENAPFVNIPKAWAKVLIFAFSDPKNTLIPVRFKAVNANTEKLGLGDLMFINSSESPIFGMVGSKKLALQSNSTAIIKNAAAPSSSYRVKLNRRDKERGIDIHFIRQAWIQSKNQSSVIFIYSPPNSNRVSYYTAPVRGL